jgi:hypothetical protein
VIAITRRSTVFLAFLLALAALWSTGAAGLASDLSTAATIRVAPSGGDDTQAIQAALDAATQAGPGAVIELSPGSFRVGRPLVGMNLDVTIRGAGMGQTEIIADGSVNRNGLFQLLPADETAALRTIPFPQPILFLFHEGDVDRFGQPAVRRSQRIVMTDLTLGARGRTPRHFDINAGRDTRRLFSLVWIEGNRPDWTNSRDQTPADIGAIDAEHAQVSTVRGSFLRVHFDGRNRARSDTESGDAFAQNPDVRNGFGVEGGFAFADSPFGFLFKPVNAALLFADSRFSDLPGQAGIFAPQLVGPRDPSWTFGPEAVGANLTVTRSVFDHVWAGAIVGDLSDVDVLFDSSEFRPMAIGAVAGTNFQSTEGGSIGYPASVPSRVRVTASAFQGGEVAVAMDEYFGPPLADFTVDDNAFVLVGGSQIGVWGNFVAGAKVLDNDFGGQGYGAVVATSSEGWQIHGNDFCDLLIPPSATAPVDSDVFGPDIRFPENDAQSPVVLIDSVDMRVTDNECA